MVAGTAGGRRLKSPSGRSVRPMTERVREAVFASLGSQGVIDGARVLDLFAGTGAIGIEALSRGASEAVFVEADHAAAATVTANLTLTGLPGGSVVRDDVLRYLVRTVERFDLAFADPPYRFDDWQKLLAVLPAEVAVLESTAVIEPEGDWVLTASRRYGGSVVTFLRHASQEPSSAD
ncbi:MAG TPA: 16S rRNA (guanine(966)-N(2))-methyltransferase RsmD [Acidimicrobiales bacterium]|nr:16S rRNA (guanine(966)-N(2))-methyltransferase RsmD [Acidimicrobiales bacterium]